MVDLVKPTNGPEKIYLDTNDEGERVWCQDDDPAGTGYPWIEYIRHDAHEAALSSARAEIKRLRKLDAEAATHVESLIVMRTHFTGEGQHVGWRGLGLALKEHLDAKDAEIERLRERNSKLRILASYIAGTNDDEIRVALAGNPTACDSLISLAAALIREQEE